jgi:GINS complex subunit 1
MSDIPGSRSKTLVTELLRETKAGGLTLPRFNDESVRTVVGESKELFKLLEGMMDSTPLDQLPEAVKVACKVHNATIKRNKRCALAYVESRASRIKRLRWEIGPLLPEDILRNLSNSEKTFLSEYDKLLTDYKTNTCVDVTADLSPPKGILVQVRVLRDVGEVIFEESGAVNLVRGTTHTLRRRDVESLVLQGYLEEIQHQESC